MDHRRRPARRSLRRRSTAARTRLRARQALAHARRSTSRLRPRTRSAAINSDIARQANSYDAWTPAQFEQYIRELTFFGANSIEGIPFQDDRKTPVMKFPRREMNRAISDICNRYGLDYWLWLPAEFDLKDSVKRRDLLGRCEELFRDCRELTGIFFPGGDPGHNPPELVLPFLEDLSRRMLAVHPRARIWLSLQWFTPEQIDFVYAYLNRENPDWFAGLVAGPSGPPIGATRERLPRQYRLRLYPDLTHNKLCQYQVPEWDQAYALTLGREAINPRPAEYAAIHNRVAGYSDGFISYSDGVHDDVNKTIWSARSWDPASNVRDVLVQYARVYFSPAVAEDAADAILALEKNWHGPLAENGAVETTLLAWQRLDSQAPVLANNWRWQMCLLRANYDAYIRRRLLRESKLEVAANDGDETGGSGRLGCRDVRSDKDTGDHRRSAHKPRPSQSHRGPVPALVRLDRLADKRAEVPCNRRRARRDPRLCRLSAEQPLVARR